MTFVDFALLPPEVNSARMYAGAGSAPLLAAAGAWHGLSAQLNSAALSYGEMLSELTDAAWHGSSAISMAAAVQPYVSWMHTTAAEAAQVASQAQQAVAAYEAAFAATVPPSTVAANRTMLAALVATNVLGQNAPAIAANQAEYSEMWAQDAAAMHGYAASAAATQLPALSAAPQHNSGQHTQPSTAVSNPLTNLINPNGPIGQLLKAFGASPLMNVVNTQADFWADFFGLGSGYIWFSTMFPQAVEPLFSAGLIFGWPFYRMLAASHVSGGNAGIPGDLMPGTGVLASGYNTTNSVAAVSNEVSASVGRATPVGGLSVPASWGVAAPEARLATAVLPAAGPVEVPPGRMAGLGGMPGLGGLGGGMPVVGSVVNTPKQGGEKTFAGKVVASKSKGPDDGWPGAPTSGSALSERDELNKLRKSNADLVREREALRRAAVLVAKQ